MNTIFTYLFVLISSTMNTPQADLITGDWVFQKALNDNLDENSLASLREDVIGKWKFMFRPDGTFETTIMGEQQSGKWKLSTDSKKILVSEIEGGPMELEILRSTEHELALRFGLGEFLLKRITD